MVDWNRIGKLIKHDGKIPKSLEEIQLEKMQKDRIIRENKLRQEKKEQLAKEAEALRAQKILDKIEWEKGAEKRLLDAEEAKLNGELDYLDKLESKCKKCGKDILDINGTCSATKCGAYKYQDHPWSRSVSNDIEYGSRPPYIGDWSIDKGSLME